MMMADMSTNQFMNESIKMNQGLIITGQMILRNWCQLIKMQRGSQEKGDNDFSDNDDEVDDGEDDVGYKDDGVD